MKTTLKKWSGKYYTKSLSDLAEDRQKRLDKIDKLLYNIRTGSEENMGYTKLENVLEYSVNPAKTEKNLAQLAERQKEIAYANSKTGLTGFIAGGAIRDTVLGVFYNDIDVFIPSCSNDDDITYYTEMMRDCSPDTYERAFTRNGDQKYEGQSRFAVWSYTRFGLRNGMDYLNVQAIGRQEGTVEDIVNGFDYGLVKAYQIGDDIFLHDSFRETLRRKRFEENLPVRTYYRVQDWRNRHTILPKIVLPRMKSSKANSEPSTVVFKTITSDGPRYGIPIREVQVIPQLFEG
jgi:hypothetical protein